jgi:hypothetical protein
MEHASNVTSQFGQDGIVLKILEVIGQQNGWCVEFGAWDGKYLSNTWSLIANRGWTGVLIEGNEAKFGELMRNHQTHAIHGFNDFVGWEGDHTLDAILAKTPIPYNFDFLSIDIDGNDWHVWAAFNQYRPRVICIEFNPTVPNEVVFVQDRDPSINQGCSLLALIDLAKSKGYELVCVGPTDAFFVPNELYSLFKIPSNDIDSMLYPNKTLLWQGYDGTFWATGNLNIVWKGAPIGPDEFQVLPRSMRRFT